MRGATELSDPRNSASCQRPSSHRTVEARRDEGTRSHGLTRSYQPPSAATHPAASSPSRVRARSGSRIPVRTARCSRVAGSQSKASQHDLLAWVGRGARVVRHRSGRRGEAERHEHVGGVEHRRAPVGDQPVRALAGRAAHGAGNGHHRDVAIGGLLHREHRSTGGVRLDHDDEVRQRRDDPVAGREAPGVGPRSERRLGEEQAGRRAHGSQRSRCLAG